eukprot:IDg3703t1
MSSAFSLILLRSRTATEKRFSPVPGSCQQPSMCSGLKSKVGMRIKQFDVLRNRFHPNLYCSFPVLNLTYLQLQED